MQPEIAIFVETNLREDWNPFSQVYTAFRTPDNENRGVLILAKSELKPKLQHIWEDKGLCVELICLRLLIIGLYTPYYKDMVKGKDILASWTENKKWIAFGDHENMVTKFAKFGNYCFLPKYSREVNGKLSVTDAIYGNLAVINASLDCHISDHYALKCEIAPGVKLQYRSEKAYKRSEIIKWALKKNSKLRAKIVKNWPSTPMIQLIQDCIPKRRMRRTIWVPTLSSNATKEEIKRYRQKQWKEIEAFVLDCVNSNNMAKLAKTTRKLLGMLRKAPFQKGACNDKGKYLIDGEADKCFVDYYRRLYTSKKDNLEIEKILKDFKAQPQCDIVSPPPANRTSKHKAMSVDIFPDELLDDEKFSKNAYHWACRKMKGEPIETIYKQGRLILLSKVASEYPTPYDTRPIIVFSAIRKYLEYMWLDKYSETVWKHIGLWQGGFRPGHGTQELIVNLCKWLHTNRKAAIGIFVDVEKAFDSIDRNQVIELAINIGIDAEGIKMLCELLQNATIEYKGYIIEYNRGVPQGSALSPLLFNLLYDTVLKEAVANGWFVQAYADDLFIGITSIKEYSKVLKWLDSWEYKACIKVNDKKTKEFRIGRYRNTKGRYEVVSSFKYLGVEVYSSRIAQSSKRRCIEAIKRCMKISKLPLWLNHRVNYFSLLWWFASHVLYTTVYGIVCGFYDENFVFAESIKRIRALSKAPRRMSNSMLGEFFGLNLKPMLSKVAEKIRIKLGEKGKLNTEPRREAEVVWVKTISSLKLTPRMFTAWNGRKRLACKICHQPTSLRHLASHQELSELTYRFLEETAGGSIFKAIEVLQGITTLRSILKEAEDKWKKLIEVYSQIIQ
eukprot:TRINITY_DN669_c0_g2_i12.p2 TRINITY_DN669_c0_g2~~TRINITY_DN669_c0_g2_i12.p2  ORF type:complete len:842 (+),score=43.29 TRINITY_DN669_c0_g2_i12:2490-5015(+)